MFIKNKPNLGDEKVVNVQKLFELRNKLTHSYPDKNYLEMEQIWFDKKIPILLESKPYDLLQTASISLLPTRKEAINSKIVAEDFNVYLFDCFLQELFPQSCKLFFHSIASPFSIELQVLFPYHF